MILLLNETENKEAATFVWEHYKIHGKTAECTIHAKQTGLGFGLTIKCPYCNIEKNITDYSVW